MTSNKNPRIRILTAVPLCDGHDSAINTLNLEFIRYGLEVIYLGYHRSVPDIARAAIQEDVRAIGISTYNGGHVEFFSELRDALDANGGSHIGIFGGGGGTITAEDANEMYRHGTDRIFFAGTPLTDMMQWVQDFYGKPKFEGSPVKSSKAPKTCIDRWLARRLTDAETALAKPVVDPFEVKVASKIKKKEDLLVLGVTGPGGTGKTTTIDELILRFLHRRPKSSRIAILSHDPSIVGAGALLGDRATMIYSQDDRVFMRSMATRGQGGGLSPATGRCLDILISSGQFECIIIETVGIGQEAIPFSADVIDKRILVMNPDYGSRLQLQKIAMLNLADIVVVNKSDLQGAKTAFAEVEDRLQRNRRGQYLLASRANLHGDPGVDALYEMTIGMQNKGCNKK